jgi:dUTP pyrophosphatase
MTQPITVPVRRVGEIEVPLPRYETSAAAGVDLRAAIAAPVTIPPGERRFIPTGLAFAIPVGYEGQVRPRSGLALRHGLSIVNSPGTIDADYRGEVGIVLINHGAEPYLVEPLARIAQLVFAPVATATLVLAEALDETGRGPGGYGSTGI